MSEAVKRYVIRHGCVEEASSLLPGERAFVLAADHDRIVSALIAGREAAERENESLRSKARASEQAALELRAEVERLQRELGTAHADASHYASTAEDLRAEGERLRIALSHAGAWIEAAPHGDNCFVSNHYDGDPGSRCNCGKDAAHAAIDAALEASR